ncbi:MAG: hypothetical protein ACK528_12205, partial [Alphaproteobacteria bacterium]
MAGTNWGLRFRGDPCADRERERKERPQRRWSKRREIHEVVSGRGTGKWLKCLEFRRMGGPDQDRDAKNHVSGPRRAREYT